MRSVWVMRYAHLFVGGHGHLIDATLLWIGLIFPHRGCAHEEQYGHRVEVRVDDGRDDRFQHPRRPGTSKEDPLCAGHRRVLHALDG